MERQLRQVQFLYLISFCMVCFSPALIKDLQNLDAMARMEASEALGKIGVKTKSIITALTKSLSNKVEDVRQAAAVALDSLSAKGKK